MKHQRRRQKGIFIVQIVYLTWMIWKILKGWEEEILFHFKRIYAIVLKFLLRF